MVSHDPIWVAIGGECRKQVSLLRMIDSSLLSRLSDLMAKANMQEVAEIMGVSPATAYRYRKKPSDMSLEAFSRLAQHFGMPVSMNLFFREDDVLAAEEARLRLEEEIAESGGWRFVTTPHFTVNVELDDFTRALFLAQYGDRYSDAEAAEYARMRALRRKLYLSGRYHSEEIVNGASYIDFFYGRGVFKDIDKSLRKRQLEEIVTTTMLPHVSRKIYTNATPELPTILSYSNRKTVVRIDELTIILTDNDADEMNGVLRKYAEKSEYFIPTEAQAFFLNPLSPHGGN